MVFFLRKTQGEEASSACRESRLVGRFGTCCSLPLARYPTAKTSAVRPASCSKNFKQHCLQPWSNQSCPTEMLSRVFRTLAECFILSSMLAMGIATSPPAVVPPGAHPGDAIWTMNVSTTVDNCNWWNNYGDIAVGSPNGIGGNLTFESVCQTSFWGGLDINVLNNDRMIAFVRAKFSFGHYMVIHDGSGKVLANMRESWGTMFFRSFYSVFYLYEGEGDVLIGRAERSTFLNSELKWFAAVKGEDCDDSSDHNNCVLLAVDEYKMTWSFLACAGYPWNFAWVNMPSNPVHRMAIQVPIARLLCSACRLLFCRAHTCTDCLY